MKILLTFLIILSHSMPAYALRCGNKLIGVGDLQYKVLKNCGEPVHQHTSYRYVTRERHITSEVEPNIFFRHHGARSYGRPAFPRRQYRQVGQVTQIIKIDEWTYDFGSGKFIRVITFENGSVKKIKTKGYGSD